MTTYWHCTPRARTPSILDQGLLVGCDQVFVESDPDRLYLTGNVGDAFNFGRYIRQLHSTDIEVDVLRLNADVPVEPDPNQVERWTAWWMTTECIPARAITKIYPLESLLWAFPYDRFQISVAFGHEQGSRIIPRTELPARRPLGRRIYRLVGLRQ